MLNPLLRAALYMFAALPLPAQAATDPLAAYYDNTLIALGPAGEDQGHLWLEPNSFTQFGGPRPPRTGATTATPIADSGATRLCLVPTPTTLLPPPSFAAAAAGPDRFATCLTLRSRLPGEHWSTPGRLHWRLAPGQQ